MLAVDSNSAAAAKGGPSRAGRHDDQQDESQVLASCQRLLMLGASVDLARIRAPPGATPTQTATTAAAATTTTTVAASKRIVQSPKSRTFGCRRQTASGRSTNSIMALSSLPASRPARSGSPASEAPPLVAHKNSLWRLLAAAAVLTLLVASAVPRLANGIKLQPEGKEKFFWSGEQFVITCQNNNNVKNVKIRWHGPSGAPISDDRSQRVHVESNGVHASRLVVMNATSGVDEGPYDCAISVADARPPREADDFVLHLLRPPNFRDTPRKLVHVAGQPAVVQCRVEFDANVSSGTVNWYKDSVPVDMLNDSAIQVLEYEPARQTSQLQISTLRRDHKGVYQCEAIAVTSKLSKISQHDIELEVSYAPVFGAPARQQTVWVERLRSSAQGPPAQQQLADGRLRWGAGPDAPTHPARSRIGHPKYPPPPSPPPPQAGADSANATARSVRVELRCSCLANPPASIVWYTSANSMYTVQRGEPEYVTEQPTQQVDGHYTSSLLVIQYSLEPNWAHRRETYTCSASNKLGKDSQTYIIEQGDPPPAFDVAPLSKRYEPQTSQFRFTLLGPNFDPGSGGAVAASESAREIVPPVDSLRIRAELAGQQHHTVNTLHEYHYQLSKARRQDEPSVAWQQRLAGNGAPQNVTVSLARLPAGPQRLFLEAHNAVGWSPNSTYLGEYYIVSAASSWAGSPTRAPFVVAQLLLACAYSYYYLIVPTLTFAHRRHEARSKHSG